MNIGEIAKLAGVSSAAVSRYFNNGYISEEKRETIRKVVEKTGYRPSVQAQMLRTKKTKMIGVILPKIDLGSITSMVSGLLAVLNENGYQLLLANTQNNSEKELEYLSTFNSKQVDGVVFIATIFTAKHRKALKEMTVPVVIAGQRLSGYPCIYHDDYNAVYELTSMFLKKGCRQIGYLGVLPQDKAAGQARFEGYCNAVTDGGLKECRENTLVADFTMESGYEKTEELIRKCGLLDGLICATDEIAIGAIQYFKSQKISVPGDILVAGIGDSALSKVTTPTVTTVHYSFEKSGELAAEMLLNILVGNDCSIREVKLGYSIVENESSRK